MIKSHKTTKSSAKAKTMLILGLLCCWQIGFIRAQDVINQETIEAYADSMLVNSPLIQIEATAAINDMYNFKFERAHKQFLWFRDKYPEHPLPYFLLGLNEWWQIMPNFDNEQHDEAFFNYMDESLSRGKNLYDEDPENPEASFFLAATYAFKSRLHAERKHWTRATVNAKQALNYLRRGRDLQELSPEFLFGEGLYNYYSVWIPENYPWLKPVLLFFRKGDQALGIEQLEQTTQEAFYTRTEAQYFLMRIYRNEEKQPRKALEITKYLAETFPDNAYFQRYYASSCYSLGYHKAAEITCQEILRKIAENYPGYEGISGRYAAYILGYIYKYRHRQPETAATYFQQAIHFAEQTESFSSGYYQTSLAELARLAHDKKNYREAKSYYQKVKKHAKRKDKLHKEAREYLRKYRRKR